MTNNNQAFNATPIALGAGSGVTTEFAWDALIAVLRATGVSPKYLKDYRDMDMDDVSYAGYIWTEIEMMIELSTCEASEMWDVDFHKGMIYFLEARDQLLGLGYTVDGV